DRLGLDPQTGVLGLAAPADGIQGGFEGTGLAGAVVARHAGLDAQQLGVRDRGVAAVLGAGPKVERLGQDLLAEGVGVGHGLLAVGLGQGQQRLGLGGKVGVLRVGLD